MRTGSSNSWYRATPERSDHSNNFDQAFSFFAIQGFGRKIAHLCLPRPILLSYILFPKQIFCLPLCEANIFVACLFVFEHLFCWSFCLSVILLADHFACRSFGFLIIWILDNSESWSFWFLIILIVDHFYCQSFCLSIIFIVDHFDSRLYCLSRIWARLCWHCGCICLHYQTLIVMTFLVWCMHARLCGKLEF